MPRKIDGANKPSALFLLGIFLSVANFSGNSAGAREPPANQLPAVDIAEAAGKACDSAKSVTPKPYRGVFYENDFSFLDDPCYQAEKHGDAFGRATDSLKRVNLAPGLVADFGGEYRARFHVERNHGSTKLANLDNDFLLQRVRLYANFEAGDFFRLYAEGIDASIQFEDLTARTIELNRFDILNLFVDGKVSAGPHKFVARIGRQELLFGGQRLISPLDWGNTRRTFDGVRLIGDSPDWSVSLFGAHPVLAGQRAGRGPGQEFDEGESSQLFLGGYGTYKGIKRHLFDAYLLRLTESDATPAETLFWTAGGRWKGAWRDFMGEIEGAGQWGHASGLDQSSGMFTAGIGYKFAKYLPWKPVLWVYYDWASGDGNPTDGKRGTFNQLFPLAHAYFGYIDLVGRQNIQDVSAKLVAKPHKIVTAILAYHNFRLDDSRDALYNAGGGAIRRDASGASGTHVGDEVDLVLKVRVTPRVSWLAGYSRFFAGDFVDRTNPAGVSGNASFFYTQLGVKF